MTLIFTPDPLPGSEALNGIPTPAKDQKHTPNTEKKQDNTKLAVEGKAPGASKSLPPTKMSQEAVAYIKKLVGPEFSHTGTVHGQGRSIWHNQTIEFKIAGTYDFSKLRVYATKQHVHKNYANCVKYEFMLDVSMVEDLQFVTLKAINPDVYLERKTKTTKKEEKDGLMCVVCMEPKVDTLLEPCKHLCCCALCANCVPKCPVCRSKIENRTKIYIT